METEEQAKHSPPRTQVPASEPAAHSSQNPPGPKTARSGVVIKIGLALAVIAAAAVLAFFLFHHHAEPASERNSLVTVAAAPVTRGEIFNEEEIPGEFRAYVEVELHAKVSGYVDQMNV